MVRLLIVALFGGPALAGLASCDSPQEIICVGEIVVGADGKTRCIGRAPSTPDGRTGPDAVTSPDVPGRTDVVVIPEVSGPDPELQCAGAELHWKPLMAACSKHCECQTGYCYDEGAYLGGFRFCTRPCNGSCADLGSGTLQDTVCLNLNALRKSFPAMVEDHICATMCSSPADCEALSTDYDTCGTAGCSGGNATCWGGTTLALQKTCQIKSTIP
ncbi:MAG: hypothetical protein H6744_17410 [Deltaproteobacteria bacterium]|nr:hypothetical protein [Deltaproteobacteria bacterium]MCB9788463.1 hypothetical protein [Deltaproteobacteria bacterium]